MEEHDHNDQFDLGLQEDMKAIVGRRRALKMMGAGAGGLLVLAACGKDAAKDTARSAASGSEASTASTATTAATAATSGSSSGSYSVIPEETAGPYPGDGSNGVNALTQSGIVRRDITSSFGSSSTTATGVPLAIEPTVLDAANGQPMANAAVYLWHCDSQGRYSLYSQGVTGENYLRGVQATDANGKLSFDSIFPGAYSGRWPHIHFEVYPSVATTSSTRNKIATSQIALPKATCDEVYATSGYRGSPQNLARTSLTQDMVFHDDGAAHQLATMSGSVSGGYTARLVVPV